LLNNLSIQPKIISTSRKKWLDLQHPSYSHKNSEQLFREWNEVDFPKLTLGCFGFGKSVPRNERNNCQLLLKGAGLANIFA